MRTPIPAFYLGLHLSQGYDNKYIAGILRISNMKNILYPFPDSKVLPSQSSLK